MAFPSRRMLGVGDEQEGTNDVSEESALSEIENTIAEPEEVAADDENVNEEAVAEPAQEELDQPAQEEHTDFASEEQDTVTASEEQDIVAASEEQDIVAATEECADIPSEGQVEVSQEFHEGTSVEELPQSNEEIGEHEFVNEGRDHGDVETGNEIDEQDVDSENCLHIDDNAEAVMEENNAVVEENSEVAKEVGEVDQHTDDAPMNEGINDPTVADAGNELQDVPFDHQDNVSQEEVEEHLEEEAPEVDDTEGELQVDLQEESEMCIDETVENGDDEATDEITHASNAEDDHVPIDEPVDPEEAGDSHVGTESEPLLESESMDVDVEEANDSQLVTEESMNGDAGELQDGDAGELQDGDAGELQDGEALEQEEAVDLPEKVVDEIDSNSVLSDVKSLPQCRLKRNYSCLHCGFNTQNPREHLYHLRDEHGERMKVFECPRCIYASKNQQKLIRHARMVHKLKIKTKDRSTSPSKKRSRSPRAKVSPAKSSRDSMSPGKSSRSSPGKSPRSTDDVDGWEEDEDDDDGEDDESPTKDGEKRYYNCEHCEFVCRSRKLLNRHETTFHLKRRFFRCVKCNYVTHLKGRYTKHMKYHQLPILKCEFCDFRTPYRWNLDRHMKNHTEDSGEYKCHLCNFAAQIKQSLTVHISNHHLTPEQIRERELKRTIGISDPADCTSDDQELEMMRLERDEHPDALRLPPLDYPDSPSEHDGHPNGNSFRVSNIDMGGNEDSHISNADSKDEDGEPLPKKPKIKITLKKMKEPKQKDTFFQELNERHNFEEDFIHPDDVVHRHGNVYIKTFKCHYCPFKAAFKNEVSRHEKKIHGVPMPKSETHSKKTKKSSKSAKEHPDTVQQILQYPQVPSKSEEYDFRPRRDSLERERKEHDLKEKVMAKNNNNNVDQGGSNSRGVEDSSDSQTASSKESSPCKDVGKKKNSSFFDKLQEKISTSNVQNLVCQFCGHESKCLSESVRHQKLHLSAKHIYASASLSTRCQFCRHRCKTTDDLGNHLKMCTEARKNQIMDSGKRISGGKQDGDEEACDSYQEDYTDEVTPENDELTNDDIQDDTDDDKHPMENRVFVWNKIKNQQEAKEKAADESNGKVEPDDSDSKSDILDVPSKESSKSPVMMDYVLDYIEGAVPQGQYHFSKRVFRCPQCTFWATTASRFHVHIVGHFNKKPYNCSECGYKSNWRWDITKHIKLKTTRDNSHQKADVVITDSTGEKNYEKYDRYLTIVQVDEGSAHRTEGGIPNKKGRPKRTPDKDEEPETVTPTTSPVRKPPMVSIPMMPRLQSLPRLTRAPAPTTSHPGPMPFGPILPGPQMMVQIASSGTATSASTSTSTSSRPPPPLSLRGPAPLKGTTTTTNTTTTTTNSVASSKPSITIESAPNTPVLPAQYQIITAQGAVNTSLETLQLLASGSTNLARLKKIQKDCVVRSEEKESQNPNSHQVSVSSTGEDGREVAKMVLDHEGNPEWKCNTCDFRDSERETVVQHVRLAHARGGPVSLLHAVHRCDVCGYAAGTKRAVQLHIDSSHGGQGGITSRCEGQTPDPKDSSGDGGDSTEHHESPKLMKCRICPFTCKKRTEMRAHVVYHTARPDCVFKCMFCPYYVPSKVELFEHLSLHGMEVPASVREAVKNKNNGGTPNASSPAPANQQDDGSRQFLCGACPFETRSRAKLMHHRQFHKPKGLPFKCPHCTYNVTRRHLLSQHIRVHGVDPGPEEGLDGNDNNMDDRSNSPSPSLTITPVNNVAAVGEKGEESTFTDASVLPKLTDQTTMLLEDIPLVWVSRDNRFFKMFKCRHCPHVNLRKTNIQEHEKMHKSDAARESGGLHCPHCSYVSVNAGVMSAHLKVHAGSMGQCHAIVDPSLSDEDQLRILTTKVVPSPSIPPAPVPPVKEEVQISKGDEKLIYFCQLCPGRFFFEKEIQIHSRFHTANLPHHCKYCNFGARQEAHLLTHAKVHSPEYQQRTRTMMSQHRAALSHRPVPGLSLPADALLESVPSGSHPNKDDRHKRSHVASPPPSSNVIPQPPPTSKYMCDQCPASFSKLLTLQYHQSLHGAKNPHHCQRCSYAGKTEDNLKQHQQLHNQHDESVKKEQATKEPVPVVKEPVKKSDAASNTVMTGHGVSPTVKTPFVIPGRTEKYRIEYPKSQKASFNKDGTQYQPPIKLKFIGLKPLPSENGNEDQPPQFKYYVEEQVPRSGVDLLRRKTELEKEEQQRGPPESSSISKSSAKNKVSKEETEETDPMRIGDRSLYYPLHIDKVSGKSRQKRYKCSKCPSAFEKMEQYNVHINLHGSNYRYKCQICDYSVKFFANFRMHINRHKYHEKMVAQHAGTPSPPDDDPKYMPTISNADSSSDTKSSKNKIEDKENMDNKDLTTTERQHLLLQTKKGVEITKKDTDRERQVYYCLYCPYANVRRDAVDSHSYRHLANGGYGVYKCTLCDYTASQLNFIKEHTKVHFRPFKYVNPEGFMRHDRHEIFSTPTVVPGSKQNDGPKSSSDNGDQSSQKYSVFSHESGVFKPLVTADESDGNIGDSHSFKGIKVNYRSGDVVDAPNDFVIQLRNPKSKSGNKTLEVTETVVSNLPVLSKTNELTVDQSVTESTKVTVCESTVTSEGTKNDIASQNAMEVDTPAEQQNNETVNLTNGHIASEEEGEKVPESNELSDKNSINKDESTTLDEEMEVDVETLDNLPSKAAIANPWGSEKPESLVSSH